MRAVGRHIPSYAPRAMRALQVRRSEPRAPNPPAPSRAEILSEITRARTLMAQGENPNLLAAEKCLDALRLLVLAQPDCVDLALNHFLPAFLQVKTALDALGEKGKIRDIERYLAWLGRITAIVLTPPPAAS